ncbi:MAG: sulfatase-like hydrolase/transferase, partial [bacterium]
PAYISEFSRKPADWLHEQSQRMNASQEIRETISDLYDAEINFVDGFVERLFKEVLPADNTLVIITADHGEMLFEHGLFGHAQSLFEQELRIPLIIVPPVPGGFKATAVSAPVSSIDLYPTILDLAGIPVPAQVQGQSLRPLLDGQPANNSRAMFAEFDRGPLPVRSLVVNNWKLISGGDEAGGTMLFDLSTDPGETTNLVTSHSDKASALGRQLDEWIALLKPFNAPKGTIQLTTEQENVLRSLGYVK